MKYKGGFKYQLDEEYKQDIGIVRPTAIITEYLNLYCNGVLTIKRGYCWDGPSGPTIDTKNFMRGSLVHDALYQLIRMGKLEFLWRNHADKLLRSMCRKDGMSAIRAWYVYRGLFRFGGSSALPENKKEMMVAP